MTRKSAAGNTAATTALVTLLVAAAGCDDCAEHPHDRCDGLLQQGDDKIVAIIQGRANDAGGAAHVVVSLVSAPAHDVTLSQTNNNHAIAITPDKVVFTPTDFTNKTFDVVTVPGVPSPDPIPSWVVAFDPTVSDDPAWNCVVRSPVFDTIAPVGCGDTTVEDGEDCEPDLNEDAYCDYGLLACTWCDETCHFAAGIPSFCGDGVITNNALETPEECDTALPFTDADSCATRGFPHGELACNDDCTVDASGCSFVDPVFVPEVESGHMCVLDPSRPGRVRCWGKNDDGEAQPPTDTGWVDVANGARHSCALRDDGSFACWGVAAFYAGAPAGPFQKLSLGAEHTCGLGDDGAVTCFGNDADGQTDAPAGNTFVDVAAGGFHSCALDDTGAITCWGDNAHEQGTVPASPGGYLSVTAGTVHTCALRADHTVACWGRPDDAFDTTPTGVFEIVVADGNHTCAVAADGFVTCWGDGYSGVHEQPAEHLRGLSLGNNAGCGIADDDTLRCWGVLDRGHPSGTFTSVDARGPCALATDGTIACWQNPLLTLAQPPATPPSGSFLAVSATFDGGCALRTDHHAVCFRNEHFNQQIAPLVPPVADFQSIQFAGVTACGLLTNGNALCFGDNENGMLDVPPFSFSKIAVDSFISCGIRSDNQNLACWGSRIDQDGQPTVEAPPAGAFVDVAVGSFACGVRDTGALACWGALPGTPAEPAPVPPAGNDFVSVSVAGFACGTHADGTRTCFGKIDRGAFRVPPGSYAAVHSGWNDVCASDVDGAVRCFGLVDRNLTPFTGALGNAAAYAEVAAQGKETCVVDAGGAGTGHCWREDDGLFDGASFAGVSHLVIDGEDRCFIDPVTGFPVCTGAIAEPAPQVAVTDIGLSNHRPCALTAAVAEDPVADPPVIGSPGGALVCWNNAGDVDGALRPPGGTSAGPWAFMAVGPRHVCVSSREDADAGIAGGDVTCFGANDFGQSTPPSGRFTAMAAVDDLTCGAATVATTDAIRCWGQNPYGNPVTTGFLQLTMSLGPTTGCSVDDHHGLTCFGAVASGPVFGGVTSVGVGDDHLCVVTFGQLRCAGAARYPVADE